MMSNVNEVNTTMGYDDIGIVRAKPLLVHSNNNMMMSTTGMNSLREAEHLIAAERNRS